MKKRAEPDFSVARGLFTVPRLSHGLKRGQHFPRNPVFSREQARSAPRAHVRELLCETQSSKERLRRSRTESSAAPPAIEELAGEARQVRPARAACGSVSTDLGLLTGGEVRRASGPPAPASNILLRQVRHPASILFAHHRSWIFCPVRFSSSAKNLGICVQFVQRRLAKEKNQDYTCF